MQSFRELEESKPVYSKCVHHFTLLSEDLIFQMGSTAMLLLFIQNQTQVMLPGNLLPNFVLVQTSAHNVITQKWVGKKNSNAKQSRNECSAHHFQLSWKHADNDDEQIALIALVSHPQQNHKF